MHSRAAYRSASPVRRQQLLVSLRNLMTKIALNVNKLSPGTVHSIVSNVYISNFRGCHERIRTVGVELA